jgi:hypothetical protein
MSASGDLSAAARAELESLRSEFREQGRLHPRLHHALIMAPDPKTIHEICLAPLSHVFPGKRTLPMPFPECGELHVFYDDDKAELRAVIDALVPLAGAAVDTLAGFGILQATEPPPDISDLATGSPIGEISTYGLRQWMLFVHRLAKDQPGAPPWVESAPMAFTLRQPTADSLRRWERFIDRHEKDHPGTPPRPESLPTLKYVEPKREAIRHTLGAGVFKASALILSRLLVEGIGGDRPDPPAGQVEFVATGRNEERDQFIYDERSKSPPIPWLEVVAMVNQHAGWKPFDHDTPQGRCDAAWKALDRFCEAHPEKPDPRRKRAKNRRE